MLRFTIDVYKALFCAGIIGLVLSCQVTAFAQSLSLSTRTQVDSLFAEYDVDGSPGCACGVYRNDSIIFAKGYGIANMEHSVPITPETRFDIGSTSKQFTTTCLVLLEQQGKLSLDDDVRVYVPELPEYGDPITIRHLLTHTSGLRDYLQLLLIAGHDDNDVVTPKDVFKVITSQENLDSETGTEFSYSNTGYFLAAVIVERVSGKTLREFAHEHIFEPLGMKATNYDNDHTEIIPNRAISYSLNQDDELFRERSYWEVNGAGGVITNIKDLVKWDQNFYTAEIGGAELKEELLRSGVLHNGDTIHYYGHGLIASEYRGLKRESHSGNWGGYVAQLMRVPSEHFSIAILCNREVDLGRLQNGLLDIFLTEKFPEAEDEADTETTPKSVSEGDQPKEDVVVNHHRLNAYQGGYELEDRPGFILTFIAKEHDLYLQLPSSDPNDPASPEKLTPTSDSTFLYNSYLKLTFHYQDDGFVSRMSVNDGAQVGRRIDSTLTLLHDLTMYCGTYYSSEMDISYRLSMRGGELVAEHPRFDTSILTPSRFVPHEFSGAWHLYNVVFEVEDGVANTMVVDATRVTGLRFIRKE